MLLEEVNHRCGDGIKAAGTLRWLTGPNKQIMQWQIKVSSIWVRQKGEVTNNKSQNVPLLPPAHVGNLLKHAAAETKAAAATIIQHAVPGEHHTGL